VQSTVRSVLLSAEIEIERWQLRLLTDLPVDWQSSASTVERTARHNVLIYLQSLEIEEIPEVWLNTLDQSATIDRA
jgi:hypothetical protein